MFGVDACLRHRLADLCLRTPRPASKAIGIRSADGEASEFASSSCMRIENCATRKKEYAGYGMRELDPDDPNEIVEKRLHIFPLASTSAPSSYSSEATCTTGINGGRKKLRSESEVSPGFSCRHSQLIEQCWRTTMQAIDEFRQPSAWPLSLQCFVSDPRDRVESSFRAAGYQPIVQAERLARSIWPCANR